MKRYWYLLGFAVTMLLLAVPAAYAEGTTQPGVVDPSDDGDPAFGNEQCWTCRGALFEDGTTIWGCGQPSSGGLGKKQCEVIADHDRVYCVSYGDNCCVN